MTSRPLGFVYAFDAGPSPQDGLPSIKVGYWLQYDADDLKGRINESACGNRTTEIALRIANAPAWSGSISPHHHQHHHRCQGIWGPGNQCADSLKAYLQFAIYKLSTSGQPYDSPLETVLQQLMDPSLVHSMPGCPPALFQQDEIPAYSFVNETSFDGHSTDVRIAEPGNPFCPWRTWYLQNTTSIQQARQWAVGIVTRGPPFGSEPLSGPQEVEVELVCTRAPKEFHLDEYDHDHDGNDKDDERYAQPPDHDGYPGDGPKFFGDGPNGIGGGFENHPDVSRLTSFLGSRGGVIDAFDFDADYDFDDDEEDADDDCPSSGDT
ncbi:hypothetical protein PISL3812_08372 [Talaromyces islandicus]|uniref:Uncharacterized protein n=1 Tax=Talaromyces islandicus TaxID=28573 RepID=A0A0U1M6U2_TALIS|nr:hypothetical protein PISL3812_08372 [Talaromyces islandicus]